MSSDVNSQVSYYCHSCGCKPSEGVAEDQDGELKCLRCGEGFIELIEEQHNDNNDDSLSSFLSRQQQRSPLDSFTNVHHPPTTSSSYPPSNTSSSNSAQASSASQSDNSNTSSSSANSNQQPQQPQPSAAAPPPMMFFPPLSPFDQHHHHPSSQHPHHQPFNTNFGGAFPYSNSGFHVSLASPDATRLTPGVPGPFPPSFDPSMFAFPMPFDPQQQQQQQQQQQLAFTTTMNNVDFTQFVNSLFENIGQFVDGAGFDRVVQFIMENDVNRFGSPPASAAVVAALPEETLTAETAVGDCAICQEDFKVDDKVKRFPCQLHSFHTGCIGPWLTEHNSCPVCRYELPTDDPDYERRRQQREQQQQSGTESEPQQQQPMFSTFPSEPA